MEDRDGARGECECALVAVTVDALVAAVMLSDSIEGSGGERVEGAIFCIDCNDGDSNGNALPKRAVPLSVSINVLKCEIGCAFEVLTWQRVEAWRKERLTTRRRGDSTRYKIYCVLIN